MPWGPLAAGGKKGIKTGKTGIGKGFIHAAIVILDGPHIRDRLFI